MDYQKPVKVKSRWTQSCQMEMLMEESQSSLDMSDVITDVSTSDLNDSAENNSELNSVELRRSRRTNNKTDFRQLNGLKKTRQQKSTSSKISNKVAWKKNQSLNSLNIENENKCKDYMLREFNIIHSSVNLNNIKMCQLRRQSLSVNNINNIVNEKLPPKPPIRRASLSWKFTFTPTNEIKNSNSNQEKDIHFNISNKIKNLNLNDKLLEISSSTSNGQLCKDKKLISIDNTIYYENTFQKSYPDINTLNFKDVHEQINSNISMDKLEKEKSFKISNLVKSNFSELKNVQFSSIFRPKLVRSKSLDLLTIKTNNNIKRSKSYNDINNSINSVAINDFKIKVSKNKSPKKKRRQSKRIKPKDNYIELLDNIITPVVDYDKEADEIYKEHKNQLAEARINDKEFDEKLKSTNFTLINENIYRPNRQTLKLCPPSEVSALRKLKQRVISGDINDYCECTLTKEDIIKGNTGCDDRCLNRLLKVECGLGCSLKHYCTNKQFQNKQFKKTNIFKTENKGYGICAVEDIPKGFLISEFVGEVIDYNEMCNRLKKKVYNNLNYMIQLNSDEIIDSTSKGNVTRFINHSCDPNAVGEKWHVLGQSRIGFFSTRHIKEGEEITFDYSFQIFGNDAQVCYCGSSKCRGYISKAPQNLSSSEDDGDDTTEINFISKPETQKRKTKLKKSIISNDNKKLRELSRQLTEVAKLKTGCRADQEMATLNLNRLMVHITDSVSRLHVLKFIREHDMNKRLFMDFSGLSIIHNWMTSNENESFKLMILEILDELPIMNRNTITKSKVLDVVSEWAGIPQDIKTKIESLEYPPTELQKHFEEIENILPRINEDDETVNGLVNKAISLWKKWIVLKMVYKIPKKIDQQKTIEEVDPCKPTQDLYPSPMDITVLDHKTFRVSNKYGYKIRNPQTVSLERMKLRKEYELKVEQERQQIFRKKVMDNWIEQREEVVKKQYQNYKHEPTLNYLNCDNFILNQNNGIVKQTRWDCSSQVAHISQNSIPNYNMQIPCLDFMSSQTLQQPLTQFQQFPYMQPQLFSNYHVVNQPTFFNTPPPPLPNNLLTVQPQIPFISDNKLKYKNTETPDLSPTSRLLKSADSNVFKLIKNSLHKHYNENFTEIDKLEKSNKSCSRDVQSGADLLARIKIISNSFKKQPSKLITINNFKQRNDISKQEKLPLSDTILKSVCNKNKKVTFINEQAGISSNTLNENILPISKNIPLSGSNKFANAILNSLMKNSALEKENHIPKKFVLSNLNSEVITCEETNKEIELYKNMKPKIIRKVAAHIKTKNGIAVVKKRQWGIKLKGLHKNLDKIPATKRNIIDKGKLMFKNCNINIKKSVLKKRSNDDTNAYLKRSKEKRVTFLIEGETSPIYPHSEVQPVNLNENIVKEKPLMKCHPFTRDEPKSILQSSVSVIEDHNLHIVERSFETTNDQIITPIVAKFKASRNRRISLRDKSVILEQLRSQRKHMIPVSMMSLSVDVLKLIPDNKKEMKKVIDYYHSMATVIVKTLGSYAKKTCLQGRIRSDEDFKYLAKKINENVLLKELQLKKVDKLKISNNTKDKVAEYIRKYMSRFGEVYKRKFSEQTNHHKTK